MSGSILAEVASYPQKTVNKEEIEAFAERIGVKIDGAMPRDQWPLPLIEKLLERIEELEKKSARNFII